MSLKGAGSALLIVLMKKKPAVAFISVPSVSYGEIFDMGAMPPVLSMPLGIMYLSSSLKRSGSASNIFHVDYIVEASKLHAAVEDNEEEIVKKYKNKIERFILDPAIRESGKIIPDVIGVSMNFTTQAPMAKQIIEQLKK